MCILHHNSNVSSRLKIRQKTSLLSKTGILVLSTGWKHPKHFPVTGFDLLNLLSVQAKYFKIKTWQGFTHNRTVYSLKKSDSKQKPKSLLIMCTEQFTMTIRATQHCLLFFIIS